MKNYLQNRFMFQSIHDSSASFPFLRHPRGSVFFVRSRLAVQHGPPGVVHYVYLSIYSVLGSSELCHSILLAIQPLLPP